MADDDTNTTTPTADDALEETRDQNEPTNVGDNPLAEDGDTPASPPTDMPDDDLPIDHPSIDSNVDPDEAYQEGVNEASNPNSSTDDSSSETDRAQ